VLVFDEHVRQIGWGLPLVASLMVLAAGVIQLARTAPLADEALPTEQGSTAGRTS
jgi:hypothetical protein